MKKLQIFKISLSVLLVGLIILPIILCSQSWPTEARDYLFTNAYSETGASNTVSSIYLGYRLMDTLGETLVLLVAITGTMSILINLHNQTIEKIETTLTLTPEKRPKNALRTHLVEVVASKLGPIILLFGFYVMLYGHISPGGGFQGGVIVASAIVFLALATDVKTPIVNSKVLSRIEALAFTSLAIVAIYVAIFTQGIFHNLLNQEQNVSANIIILLNIIIGLKVGTSIAVMCIAMMGGRHDN